MIIKENLFNKYAHLLNCLVFMDLLNQEFGLILEEGLKIIIFLIIQAKFFNYKFKKKIRME
jgi:hypothetical protein